MGNGARNSFVVSSTFRFSALALTFRHLDHHRQFVTGQQLSEYQMKYVHR